MKRNKVARRETKSQAVFTKLGGRSSCRAGFTTCEGDMPVGEAEGQSSFRLRKTALVCCLRFVDALALNSFLAKVSETVATLRQDWPSG